MMVYVGQGPYLSEYFITRAEIGKRSFTLFAKDEISSGLSKSRVLLQTEWLVRFANCSLMSWQTRRYASSFEG